MEITKCSLGGESERHPGTVVGILPGKVQVRIARLSGCASCASRADCGLTEQKDMVIPVRTPRWQEYHVGDKVTVCVGSGKGLQAVFIAYILPAVILVAGLTLTLLAGCSEPLSTLIALGADALYFGILYLCRRNLDRRFDFHLED